ncbi:MAG: hypothetical protein HMLKMBBP_00853 [Planctomycetes bacterium]|nr:hypothetical protein [Planctomycetota bacterium]
MSGAGGGFFTLGHGTVLLDGAPRVCVDPWRWDDPPCDAALVTHGHPDHGSIADLAAAAGERGIVAAPRCEEARLRPAFGARLRVLAEGDDVELLPGLRVRALPHEGPVRARGFHPRGEGLAYLVGHGGARFLFLGDSAALPEHCGLSPDVAFFAAGDFTVMSPSEAARAAAEVAPRLAVPVHWGDTSGRFANAKTFCGLCMSAGIASTPARGRPKRTGSPARA